MQYDGENDEVRQDWFESGLYNAVAPYEMMHYERNERDEKIVGESNADIGVLRDIGNQDTVLLIESEYQSLAGSYFNDSWAIYDLYKAPDHWDNDTRYEDVSDHSGFDDGNVQFTFSNATYSVFFPGMIGDEFAFYFDNYKYNY